MYIYLDNNATSPLDPRAFEAMRPWLEERVGNPSSIHKAGRAARDAVEEARERVARLVNAHPGQVIFTGGGTESNNLVIKGLMADREPSNIAVSRIEHPSVLRPAQSLMRKGWRVEYLDVDGEGRIREESLEQRLNGSPQLVSVMWANNETGVAQDIPAVAERVREAGAIAHSDAVQAAGKLPLDFAASGLHLMTLTAHKMNGPQGIGALIMDRSLDLKPQLQGGGQERGLRPGTENVAAIVGFGKAAQLALEELEERTTRMRTLRDELERGVMELGGMTIPSYGAERTPNTTQILVPGIDGETLVMVMDQAGVAISSGSACSSGEQRASHVLLAMGIDPEKAVNAVRVSVGPNNSSAEIQACLKVLKGQVEMLRSMQVV